MVVSGAVLQHPVRVVDTVSDDVELAEVERRAGDVLRKHGFWRIYLFTM